MSRYIPIDECKKCPHLKISSDYSNPLQNADPPEIWTCDVGEKTIVSRKEKEDKEPPQPDWCPLDSFDNRPEEQGSDPSSDPREIRLVSLDIFPDFASCFLPIQRKEEVYSYQSYNQKVILTKVPNKSRWNTVFIKEQVQIIADALENRLNGCECPPVSQPLDFLDVVDPLIEDALVCFQDAVDSFVSRTKPRGGETRMLVGVKQGDAGMGIEVTLRKSAPAN